MQQQPSPRIVLPLPRPVRRAMRAAGFAAITGMMLPAYGLREALASPSEREGVRDRWIRRWCEALLRLFAIEAIIENFPDPSEPGRGRLVVSNHRSTIDIGLILRTFGGHMVSRADLSTWPLLGAAARKVGTVFVDRSSAESGASAIRSMRQLLQAGRTVCIFPEGTTFEGDEVRPFYPGAFVAALHTNAEVVPVGIAYERGSGAAFVNETFLRHLSRVAETPRTRVAVCVGQAIPVPERIKAASLRDATHDAVQRLVHRARVIVDQA
jgi:1-acyl-sn-glycerol-3-phosphate acyltransferase